MDQTTFKQLIDDVKARTDLVELVGRYVELRPSGSHHVGRSMKNRDTTPSLKVWPDGGWRDFSASLGGDCFSFVQYATGCTFMEALRTLAADAGVPMPGVSGEWAASALKTIQERRRLEDLLTEATRFYFETLPGSMRWEYWQRGFTDETIDHFQLGFGRPGLWQHFEKLGVSEEERRSTGLFVLLANGERADFFANRLIFPYWVGGRVVYLIGRRSPLSGDEPWDLPKYKKLPTRSERHPYLSPHLTNDFFFGEDEARTDGVRLVCEGIADAISAHQAGFRCVSPVTTTFRKQDHDKLVRLTARAKRVVICNDSEDSGAGERGALETAKVLHAAGRDVRIASIPRHEGVAKIDVNDVVRERGAEALTEIVEAAKTLPDFLLERIPVGTPVHELATALEPLVAVLQHAQPLERGAIVGKVSERFRVGRRDVKQQLDALERRLPRKSLEERPCSARPAIVVSDRQPSDLIAEVGEVVVDANGARIAAAGDVPGADAMPLLFVRSGQMVGLRLEREQPRLHTLTETEAYGVLVRVADWFTERDGKEGPSRSATTPPHDLARDVLAFPPRGLVELDGVVSTPVFGSDGALLSAPGYHAGDRLWLRVDPRLGVVEVPASPTREHVAAARQLLETELLADFPWAGDSDRAHMLAALLLPFARRLVDGCTPLHVIEAPTAGSGKGLLAKLVGLVTTGELVQSRTLPSDDDEIRKALTAELLQGKPLIALDNLAEKRELDSAALASVLTADVWADRVLGQTRTVSVPNTAVWLASGNNPRMSLELARRCVRIRIDPKRDMPWRRDGFRHDPLIEWVRETRPALVRACLCLVQAWLAAGRPRGKQRLGSFESWAATMGGIFDVAGIPGFLGNADAFYEAADAEGETWRVFTRAWWARFGTRPVRVAELNALCEELELLEGVRRDDSPKSQQTRLGVALRSKRDAVFGGLRVVLVRDAGTKGKEYAIAVVTDGPPTRSDIGADDGFVDPWADDPVEVPATGNLEAVG